MGRKIAVEIWSDVVCPFCYMGKRRFENALQEFPHGNAVEVTWKSFQLDPQTAPPYGQSIYEYLARRKGISVDESRRMHDRLAGAARELGLRYDFQKAVVANTFNAHRLTHLARERGLQAEMEERLFSAYFTEGTDLGDDEALAELGAEVGIPAGDAREMLRGERYADAVREDAREAQDLGADGVPFFVFDRTFAVVGAQAGDVFLSALTKAWTEQEPENQRPAATARSRGDGPQT